LHEDKSDQSTSRKIYADIYIDDRNLLGIPEWGKLYELIIEAEKNRKGRLNNCVC